METLLSIFKSITAMNLPWSPFRIINIIGSEWKENEIDLIIFNRNKGIICLEAKAGHVHCEEGIWYYSSGKEMRDPFAQANSNKWKLNNEIYNFYLNNEILWQYWQNAQRSYHKSLIWHTKVLSPCRESAGSVTLHPDMLCSGRKCWQALFPAILDKVR